MCSSKRYPTRAIICDKLFVPGKEVHNWRNIGDVSSVSSYFFKGTRLCGCSKFRVPKLPQTFPSKSLGIARHLQVNHFFRSQNCSAARFVGSLVTFLNPWFACKMLYFLGSLFCFSHMFHRITEVLLAFYMVYFPAMFVYERSVFYSYYRTCFKKNTIPK